MAKAEQYLPSKTTGQWNLGSGSDDISPVGPHRTDKQKYAYTYGQSLELGIMSLVMTFPENVI